MMQHLLVLGGSSGIGKALIWEILDNSTDIAITATYNKHKPKLEHTRLKWRQFDARLEENYEDLASRFERLHGLINCIGILHDMHENHMPEKSLSQFSSDFFYKNMSLNTLPTLLSAKHFQHLLKHDAPSFFVTISARVGSIEDNNMGGWVSYRCSKAALNMALKTLAIEWRRNARNICVAALHPGTTATSLSEPFQRNVPKEKLFPPEKTAAYLWKIITTLDIQDSGGFWAWDGSPIPW